ncbi:outer membrane beta-barrel protein, partial [Neptunomonas phycophila]
DYIDTTSWTLGWSHEWTDVVASRVSYNSLNEDYVGDPSGTDDDTDTFTVGLSYDMRRWLTLGVDVSHVSFDSNQPDADYDSNTIVFKVQGSL